jgi:hypothetical protein
MIIVVGLVILVVAGVVAVAGVLGNGGSGHELSHPFAVFGYHVTGSTGTLFLYGLVVGAVVVFGLSVLLSGARRTSRLGSAARRDLRTSRRETAAVSQDRDGLIEQRATAGADSSADVGYNGSHRGVDVGAAGNGGRRHLFRRRGDGGQTVAAPARDDQGRSTGPEQARQPVVTPER